MLTIPLLGRNTNWPEKLSLNYGNQDKGSLALRYCKNFFTLQQRKYYNHIEPQVAKEIVNDLLKWDVVVNDGESILKAIEIQQRYQYSFWDSMVIQAAIKCNAALLLSEDLSTGQTINGVRIKNPFVETTSMS